ncbi:WD40 repeat-like protein [Gonapodya prolifera JEL478]|uniref:WD40 repeat-like protein n=1 Tax=Gonapodya prolifera (strain JEL478) TaxID=1344416 RepID=A0A139AY61_GONPJ|nr:WD40 repeat-like protein [Gonapodya prolifera JEL478]|eukprot:KXS21676.1 WD40 repeat-like protein [Gonapodya prolifera JEL478]
MVRKPGGAPYFISLSRDTEHLVRPTRLRTKITHRRRRAQSSPNSDTQTTDPTLERSFRGHKDVVTSVSFRPSMTQLASGSMDNSVMVWNFKPQLRAFRFVGHKAPVTCVHFSPSGNLLASSSRDSTARLWTPNVKGDVTAFKAHSSAVRSVRFSHDGEAILTSSDDKTVKLWSTSRTKFQFTLAGHLNWVRSAQFSPDSRLVLSGSDDKTVRLWDLASKTCVKTYWDHTGMITSVAFHPSGHIVASASTDRSVRLFDARTHKLVQFYADAHSPGLGQTLGGEVAAGGGVNSVSFGGSNGEWMITTGMDGLIKIWDLKEGHLFYTLHGHKQGPTTAATFSPAGDYFATGGSDAQVMVWKSGFDAIKQLALAAEKEKATRNSERGRSGLFEESELWLLDRFDSVVVVARMHDSKGGVHEHSPRTQSPRHPLTSQPSAQSNHPRSRSEPPPNDSRDSRHYSHPSHAIHSDPWSTANRRREQNEQGPIFHRGVTFAKGRGHEEEVNVTVVGQALPSKVFFCCWRCGTNVSRPLGHHV